MNSEKVPGFSSKSFIEGIKFCKSVKYLHSPLADVAVMLEELHRRQILRHLIITINIFRSKMVEFQPNFILKASWSGLTCYSFSKDSECVSI